MADPYVIKEMSFGLFRALHKGHAWMRENASRFVDPVLILHGGDDGLVAPKDSLELYEQIASWDKSLRIYAGLYHEIFNEYDKDAVIEDALDCSTCMPIWNLSTLRKRKSKATNSQPPHKNAA